MQRWADVPTSQKWRDDWPNHVSAAHVFGLVRTADGMVDFARRAFSDFNLTQTKLFDESCIVSHTSSERKRMAVTLLSTLGGNLRSVMIDIVFRSVAESMAAHCTNLRYLHLTIRSEFEADNLPVI